MKVKGLDEIIRNLQKVEKEIAKKYMTNAIEAGAKIIEEEARNNAPKRTGNLKRSITSNVVDTSIENAVAHIGPNKKGWYGKFVEFGTKKMPAQPFIKPALESKRKRALEEIRDVLAKALR